MASDRGITDDQLTTVLSFYHDLGVLVYFGGDDVTLRNTVILNPAWLVDMFRRIITAKDHQVGDFLMIDGVNLWHLQELHLRRMLQKVESVVFSIIVVRP